MSKAKIVLKSTMIGSEEEFEIKESDMMVDFLRGGYSRINRAMKEVKSNQEKTNQELIAMRRILAT